MCAGMIFSVGPKPTGRSVAIQFMALGLVAIGASTLSALNPKKLCSKKLNIFGLIGIT